MLVSKDFLQNIMNIIWEEKNIKHATSIMKQKKIPCLNVFRKRNVNSCKIYV